MILVKNGIERELTNQETIKIFKDAGWEEKTIEIKEEQPKKTSKKKK